jgi:hypothetical protein
MASPLQHHFQAVRPGRIPPYDGDAADVQTWELQLRR